MGLVSIPGRAPRIASAMGRIRYIAIGLLMVVAGFIISGFHERFKKREEMRSQSVAAQTAGDAASSNRMGLDGGSLKLPPELEEAKPAPTPAPVQTPAPAPPVTMPQMPEVDPVAKAIADQKLRAYQLRMAAIEASTGTENATTNQSAPSATDRLQADLARFAVAPNPPQMPTQGPLVMPTMGPARVQIPGVNDDPNGQVKRDFQRGAQSGDYLATTRVAPVSPWVVERGEVIPAGLPNQIVSDLPEDLIAEVKRDVYDSPTHRYVMIPAGSLLSGEYNSAVNYGQKRAQVIWTYLRFPDGSFIDLDKFVGHSADGSTGLSDQVDNHLKRLVGEVALSSLFAAGLQISQNRTTGNSTLSYPSNTQLAASAVGQQAAELGQQLANRT